MGEGLRERKKRETRRYIADMAMGLFMERGFDNVTVAEVARAADVSVNTVFNYFPTKEDLFADRQDEVVGHLAGVVRGRPQGESVVAAVRRDFLDALDTGDWRYGLHEGATEFSDVVEASPALQARFRLLHDLRENALLAALREEGGRDDPRDRVLASQLVAGTRALSAWGVSLLRAGEPLAAAAMRLRAEAARFFATLEPYGTAPKTRRGAPPAPSALPGNPDDGRASGNGPETS
ncbi:DNA-binding transcriptional regulator, AcrR family [Sinosporangium album]|uniref:DNA-binding transcriptional regulator, AcrR family n=1 Tax=Sinosporangium album TaxID=504805 RepID=A0A1G8DVU0_9ACTN|nr:TetR/AcrR family transcriptional regulator [Sinosporangium album]SDH61691.1 DNA-binding transcriptional regulator, AcrR family [Sinosporangium album]